MTKELSSRTIFIIIFILSVGAFYIFKLFDIRLPPGIDWLIAIAVYATLSIIYRYFRK